MKCNNCGFENEQSAQACAMCGAPMVVGESQNNAAIDKILPAVKDKLFLTMCILLTASCVLGIFSGSFDIISILLSVFLWIVYSDSRKNIVDFEHLRNISGTVYAQYIIVNVASIILIVCGVIMGLLLSFVAQSDEIVQTIEGAATSFNFDLSAFGGILLSIGGWLIGGIFVFVGALLLVINILGMRKIHALAKETYQSIIFANPDLVKNANTAKNWLWVFGILSAFGAITNGFSLALVSGGLAAAATIIAAILVEKYSVLNPVCISEPESASVETAISEENEAETQDVAE